MNTRLALSSLFAIVVSVGASAHESPATTQVMAVSSPSYTYEQDADHFRRVGVLDATSLKLPVEIEQRSAKGYVQVSTRQGNLLWLDEMDVTLAPPPGPASVADCRSLPTSSRDSTMAATRGAGEGCKQ